MAGDLSNILVSPEPTILTTGWGRTEGSLWHLQGYLTFVDLEDSRCYAGTPMAGYRWSGKTRGRAMAAPWTARGA
jgi:hypothetical protein